MTQHRPPLIDPRLTLVTLGVRDLAATRRFYEDTLGWAPAAVNDDIVFYKLRGVLLSFYGDAALAADSGAHHDAHARETFRGFTLAHNVATAAEVDAVFARLRAKGVRIVREPTTTFFGAYTGTFADVEGNVWEVASNPYVELDAAGDVVTHKDIGALRPPGPV